MKNLRTYGNKPFKIAVVHGGPGAPGEMASVARELSSIRDVLEPLQTATSLKGQVKELHTVLEKNADLPIILIGWSWGAMLGFIFTAKFPSFVMKLILISSGVYEEEYAASITPTRLGRLSEEKRAEMLSLLESLNNPAAGDKSPLMAQLGRLIYHADSYDPLPYDSEVIEYQYDIFRNVWKEATELRSSGELLRLGKNIQCPVVVIHGDYDPHPSEGVKDPLSRILKDFRFILLDNCGHYPWLERAARDKFYDTLKSEVE